MLEALQNGDGAALTLAGAVVIFAALAVLGLLAARLDKQDWFTEKQKPPPATTENFSTAKVGGWIMVVFFAVLAVAIYVLAGEVVAAMFKATVGEMLE